VPFSANRIKPLKDSVIDRNVAAVIVEPVICDDSPERMAYLTELREQCTRAGAILIFDEIITGFRYKRHGVSNVSGVIPDLICLGKALGGGLPLSAVAGKVALMNDDQYFVSSTFAGEILSLVACKAFLRHLQTKANIDDIWIQATDMRNKLNEILLPIMCNINGYATRGVFVGDQMTKALLFQELCKAGILVGPSWFYCTRHPEHSIQIYATFRDVVDRIQMGRVRLEGDIPSSPFAQKVRES
jgi:glutamate-1-semialdehyde aminotransferase